MQIFYSGISRVKGVKVYGDFRQDRVRCPIVSLNIGSADSSEISMLLEDEFGIEIPDEEAEHFKTIGDICKFIENNK